MNERVGVSFSLAQISNTHEIEELTQLADGIGFDSVWIPEAWGRDAFTLLAVLATQTKQIKLATGIVNIFSRTPAIVAQSIASLDDISEGRAILGLGASGPAVIEHWHGLEFGNVLRRTREFVDVVRLILSGARVDYDGEIFKLHDFSLAFEPPRANVPIFLAGIGPANIRLAGEIADGWLPIFASQSLMAASKPWLQEGADRGSRSSGPIVVGSYIPTLLGDEAVGLLKRQVAFYVGGMGSFYYRLMVRSGWAAEAKAIRDSWRSGARREAHECVSDEMLKSLAITGDVRTARQRLEAFRSYGIGIPILTIPQGASVGSIRATLEALGG